ncbi:hypothetical protein W02_27280 [Nitrospira sp. KM1]|uniref:hypothetical protein n=1 Tax=Nitrospira sp. KM1 TaxID=1936990 RepID=UPI0013A7ADA4|nr:hypothetical protein [Nitrospira sp. KM1]BCA55588.1 hypothetical protein W02_27280 [Nitrospira sp. KM1]
METKDQCALADSTVKEAMQMLGMAKSVMYRAHQSGQLEPGWASLQDARAPHIGHAEAGRETGSRAA